MKIISTINLIVVTMLLVCSSLNAQNHVRWMTSYYSKLLTSTNLNMGMTCSYYSDVADDAPYYSVKVKFFMKGGNFRTEIEDKTTICTKREYINIVKNEKLMIYGLIKSNEMTDPFKELLKYDSLLRNTFPSKIVPAGDHQVNLSFANAGDIHGSINILIDTMSCIVRKIEVLKSSNGVTSKSEFLYTKFDLSEILPDTLFDFNYYISRDGDIVKPQNVFKDFKLVTL